MHADDITQLDGCALSTAIHRREVSAREVLQASLARIEALNPKVNALVNLLPQDALLRQADERDAQLARGQSVAQIADNLKLSPSTVGTHLYHVKQKLGASNQSELTLVALQWGLLQV